MTNTRRVLLCASGGLGLAMAAALMQRGLLVETVPDRRPVATEMPLPGPPEPNDPNRPRPFPPPRRFNARGRDELSGLIEPPAPVGVDGRRRRSGQPSPAEKLMQRSQQEARRSQTLRSMRGLA